MDKLVFINVEAKPNASQRTKNRVRENGPVFRLGRADKPTCLNGQIALWLNAPNGWNGWLPIEEVKFNAIDMP